MWYLISGKLMTVIASTILIKAIKTRNRLNFFDKLTGWFLLEHLFEEYEKTAGKFFTCNEDFRRLILNLFKTARNIVFWSQLITLTEFALLTTIIVGLSWVLIFQFKLSTKTQRIFDLILLYLYTTVISLLTLKLYKTFTKYDFLMIFKSILLLSSTALIFKLMTLCALRFYKKSINIYQRNTVLLKNFTYILTSTVLGLIFSYKIITDNSINNNFNIEVTSQILPVYFLYTTILFNS